MSARALSFLPLLALAWAIASPAWAADIQLRGDRLWVTGTLDGSAVDEFQRVLAASPVRVVVFEDSVGGTAEAARTFATAIRGAGVPTELHGQCQGACAFAFLAGREHRFGGGLQVNALLIPVINRPAREELATRWRGENVLRSLAEFDEAQGALPAVVALPPGAAEAMPVATASQPRSQGAPAAAVLQLPPESASSAAGGATAEAAGAQVERMALAALRWKPEHGLLVTSTPTLFGRVHNTFYCDGTQGRDTSRCELLSEADPFKLGVLTP